MVGDAEEADAASVEERLQAYVDRKVAELRKEMLARLDAPTQRGEGDAKHCSESSAQQRSEGDVEKDVEAAVQSSPLTEPPALVCADQLDQHDSHAIGESIWDCAVFIGLDCIGFGESVVLALLLCLNLGVQLFFCTIMLYDNGMLDNPLQDDVLDGLLRFRTTVAHKVENADLISKKSLLSQVCSGEERLHVSGSQRRLYGDLTAFGNSGLWLCLLALLCWGATTLQEVNSTLRLARAVLQRRGKSTRILQQGDGDFAIESLSVRDIVKTFLLSVLPRLVTASLLCYVGALFLSRTSRLQDLLLNAMALAFILEIDELFFAAFIPHRVKSLVTGLAPLHLNPVTTFAGRPFRQLGGSVAAVVRLLTVLVAISLTYHVELAYFHGRLQQARDILCSGEQAFVYGINPASGMVVASRSALRDESLTASECAVLQVAHPELRAEFGWSPPGADCSNIPDMTQLGQAASVPVIFRPYSAASLDEAEFSSSEFDYVSRLAKASVEQAVVNSQCVDLIKNTTVREGVSSTAYVAALQDAVAGFSVEVSTCADVQRFCHMANMTSIRTLCPDTCECAVWGLSMAGVYKSSTHGCPEQCSRRAASLEELWMSQGISPLECVDLSRRRSFMAQGEVLSPRQKLTLADIDDDGNLTRSETITSFMRDVIDESFYLALWQFDLNDDSFLDESEQFAFEGVQEHLRLFDSDGDGGLSLAEAQQFDSSAYVDYDGNGVFTVPEMAGNPQGRTVQQPFKITTYHQDSVLNLYFIGLNEHLQSRPNLEENLDVTVTLLGRFTGWSQEQKSQVFTHLTTGAAVEDWIQGRWMFGQDIPHPRGLELCAFLTSWEFVWLLGINVCSTEQLASVRTVCPESCRCKAGMTDCPSTCPG